MLRRISAATLVTVAVLALAPSCALLGGSGAKRQKIARVRAANVRIDEGRRFLINATSREDNGIFFTRPPYELNGSWRIEVTAGIFNSRQLEVTGQTLFGLEVDYLAGSNFPAEFYGLYARHYTTPLVGLQVFAASEDSSDHGQVFLDDATTVDLAIETDGDTVTFLARDPAVGGGYQTVGTRSMQTPSMPHYGGFGMFGAPRGATIGFTNFRVPANADLPEGRSAEEVALDALYRAALETLDAAYALGGPTVTDDDVATAAAAIDDGATALATARTRIEELLPVAKRRRKTPEERALKAVLQAERFLDRSGKLLDRRGKRGARGAVNSIVKKMFRRAFLITDLLLPQAIRDTLPGNGLD